MAVPPRCARVARVGSSGGGPSRGGGDEVSAMIRSTIRGLQPAARNARRRAAMPAGVRPNSSSKSAADP